MELPALTTVPHLLVVHSFVVHLCLACELVCELVCGYVLLSRCRYGVRDRCSSGVTHPIPMSSSRSYPFSKCIPTLAHLQRQVSIGGSWL